MALVPASNWFQSTPLREGRPLHARAHNDGQLFQSTPLREGRLMVGDKDALCNLFQSTPLREGRLYFSVIKITTIDGFNPRPYVRGDAALPLTIVGSILFQSTPLREGRRCAASYYSW